MNFPIDSAPVSPDESIRSLVYDVRSCMVDAQNAALNYALRIGRSLIELRSACKDAGRPFSSLFPANDGDRGDPSILPFSRGTGQKLVRIAGHDLLSDCSHENNILPTDWNTLYQLARLPATKLKKLIDAGEVTPDLTRSAATKLAKENAVPTKKTKSPASQQAKATMTKREIARTDLVACLKRLKKETRMDELRDIARELGFVITIRSKS